VDCHFFEEKVAQKPFKASNNQIPRKLFCEATHNDFLCILTGAKKICNLLPIE